MKALSLCRDEFDYVSTPENRIVSLDFNHNGRVVAGTSGIEIVLPEDATQHEREACMDWARATQGLFLAHDYFVPLRGDNGISASSRGAQGVIHTEPFFIGDAEALRIMFADAISYCKIIKATLGQLPSTIILPHKSTDPGAMSRDGQFGEREFARYVLMPHLLRMSSIIEHGPEPDVYWITE